MPTIPSNADLHPVLSVIVDRVHRNSKPGARSDGHRVALAVEGGAMRGVVSAGMLVGLEMLALRDCFDAVYGTSAGAANAACFLAGQAAYGATLYYEHINSRSFVDLLRPLRGKPIVDLQFLFDGGVYERFPLAFDEVTRSGIKLTALAARVGEEGEGARRDCSRLCYLSDFSDRDDLLRALHASSRLPVLAGPPVHYRGMRLLDGGIVEEIPVHAPIADGYTHILALVTLPKNVRRRNVVRLIERLYIIPQLSIVDPVLAHLLAERHKRYDATFVMLDAKETSKNGPPYVSTIVVPRTVPRVNAFEKRRSVLSRAAMEGAGAALGGFGLSGVTVLELLNLTDPTGRRITPTL